MALRKVGIILGAGASMDAGLPNAYGLTRLVYDHLKHPMSRDAAHLYGYTLSKLIERNVRLGGSPYDPINVEDVYDGLYKLLYRENDLISDFVYSWDPILDSLKPKFNRDSFVQSIGNALDYRASLRGGSSYRLDLSKIKEAADNIDRAINSEFSANSAPYYLSIFLKALVDCLSSPLEDNPYIDDLIKFASSSGSPIATLNYDLLVESACKRTDTPFDTGLSDWKERKIVKWEADKLKILKLHGSIDWRGEFDNINTGPENTLQNQGPYALVFGGHNSKLVPHGPFLQIRHDF